MSTQEDGKNLNQDLDFPKYSYSIFKQNFAHATPFCLRVTEQSDKRNLEFKLQAKNIKDINKQELMHELNLLWRINQSQAILARIKSNSYFKIHYDHGINIWQNLKYNLYASFSTRGLSSYYLRFGVHVIDKNFQSDTRVKINNFQKPDITLYNRTVVNYDIWRLGFIGSFLPQRQVLPRSGVVLGVQMDDKISLFARMESRHKNNNYLITNYLSLVYSLTSISKGGLQVSYDYNTSKTKIECVVDIKMNKFIDAFKIKVDNELGSSWLFKFKTPTLSQQACHWFGVNYEKQRLRWGLRTQFNI